jgi:5-deoxy-glucuronate isomerase
VSLYRPNGSAPGTDPGDLVHVTPEGAGWDWSGLRVVRLEPGRARTVRTGPGEVFVLPLSGSLEVSVAPVDGGSAGSPEVTYDLVGRESVFTRVTDFAYVGRDSEITLTSNVSAEVALPSARCARRRPPAYGPAEAVPVEVRGAGSASRQVTNFGVPGVWDHAEKLIACELITPPGNWSSYPPHKHDATTGCRVVNEEIYLYRIAGPDQVTPGREGFGLHHTYTGPEHTAHELAAIDLLVQVRDLDVVLVPYGYHGPCVAAPGYPMYYLNVLAGPAEDRSMAFCDDPVHTWVRGSWAGQDVDPRVPVSSAAGPDSSSDQITSSDQPTSSGSPR